MSASTNYWSPSEFYRSVRQHEQRFDSRAVYQAINEYAPYRNPALLDVCAETYRLPMLSAISLYRHNPATFRDAILMAIGAPHSAGLWSRLATLARESLAARDFMLLGRLALVAETAWHVGRCVPAVPGANAFHEYARDKRACPLGEEPAEPDGGGRELLDAFSRVFDLEQARVTPEEYLDSALGYMVSLPASFVPPADLVLQAGRQISKAAALPGADWPLLRRFWSSYHEQWQMYPHKLVALSSAANHLVTQLARHISELPPPKEEEGVEPGDPFHLGPDRPRNQDEPHEPVAASPFDGLSVELPPPLVFARKPQAIEPWYVRLWQSLWSWFRA